MSGEGCVAIRWQFRFPGRRANLSCHRMPILTRRKSSAWLRGSCVSRQPIKVAPSTTPATSKMWPKFPSGPDSSPLKSTIPSVEVKTRRPQDRQRIRRKLAHGTKVCQDCLEYLAFPHEGSIWVCSTTCSQALPAIERPSEIMMGHGPGGGSSPNEAAFR